MNNYNADTYGYFDDYPAFEDETKLPARIKDDVLVADTIGD